ncbi:hypothetical protein ACNKHS_16765 [Shigella flexneri]
MRITALAGDKAVYSQTYFSIGSGFWSTRTIFWSKQQFHR